MFRRTTLIQICLLALAVSLVLPAAAAEEGSGESDEKTFYFIGTALARSVVGFDLSEDEVNAVVKGLRETILGTAEEVDPQVYGPNAQQIPKERQARAAAMEKGESDAFLAGAAKEKDASKTDSGLIFTSLTAGSGESPVADSQVSVNYHGTLRDGTVFDSTVQRGQPAKFGLNGVIPCWTEALQMMKVGGKAKVVCPPEIAYGERGYPPVIPGNAALTFEVELLEIIAKQEASE
jgi:FKBP-type peptidyl-prolyl cis-trans isomerase FkpA